MKLDTYVNWPRAIRNGLLLAGVIYAGTMMTIQVVYGSGLDLTVPLHWVWGW